MTVAALYSVAISSMAPGQPGFDVGVQGIRYSDDTTNVQGLTSFAVASEAISFQTILASSKCGDGTGTTELAIGAVGSEVFPLIKSEWFAFSQHLIWRTDSDGTSQFGWSTGFGVYRYTDSVRLQLTPQVRILMGENGYGGPVALSGLACVAQFGLSF